MAGHPRFLVFCVDQMQAACMSCVGHPDVRTPNLDRLASEGTLFSRTYCENPVCTPSRVSIMTGLSSRQHGVYTNGSMIPSDVPTVPSVLREAGYRTKSVGKLHLQPWSHESSPESHGNIPEGYFGFESCDFVAGHVHYVRGDYREWLIREHPEWAKDLVKRRHEDIWSYYEDEDAHVPSSRLCRTWRMEVPPELHYNNWIADRSIDYIKGLDDDEEFFLWSSFPDPHHPFAACKPYSEMYDPDEIELPASWAEPTEDMPDIPRWQHGIDLDDWDERGLREMLAQTYGMISHVDDNVGRVMEALRETGRDENTVVVFMADHGDYLGGHHLICKGMLPYEELVRVPYLWRAPGGAVGQEISEPCSLLDFAPTVLNYAGVPLENLMPAPSRGTGPWHYAQEVIEPWFHGVDLRETLETGSEPDRPPLIIAKEENRFPEHLGMERAVRGRTLVTERYKLAIFARPGNNALYDLQEDPHELHNLWNEPAARDVKLQLLETCARRSAWTEYPGRGRIGGA
ncbi:MAG: sulfatase-like hydrolase/transferase [Candidatus Brocadiia bacterium]